MNNRLHRGRLTAGGVVSVVSLLVVVGCSSDDQAPGAASTSSVGGDPQSIDPVQTDAPTTTAAPVLVFGGVDNDEFTFAADDDLDASVTALRDRYPEFASTPIAVPSDPPPDTSVKLLGYLSAKIAEPVPGRSRSCAATPMRVCGRVRVVPSSRAIGRKQARRSSTGSPQARSISTGLRRFES